MKLIPTYTGLYLLLAITLLTGCSGIMPDVASIVSEIEDTAIVVEINRDAIKENQNIDIAVKVTNKFPVTP
jgi:hypothetical protein